ncbi:class II glutamine amidotransferase [Agrococcus casei]|uniref:class II glutamine amidotransferase n=1 Tax=Agrococcus casei TaxID=343512 RepID=UPI003F8F4DDC
MCRLLGYAAPVTTTTQEVIGEANCSEWQRMGRLHADGWGTAFLGEHGIERVRSAHSGLRDPELDAALTNVPSTARLTHLRLATEGIARTLENAHPFVTDRFALAHNGSIKPVAEFKKLVNTDELEPHGGDSDTSVLVALITRALDAGLTLSDAVITTVESVSEKFPGASINLLVLSESELIAVHANDGASLPTDEFDEANLGDDLPLDHIDHYYQLSYRRAVDGTVAFTSSGLAHEGWTPMRQNSVATVDLETLRLEFHDLRVGETVAA